MITFSTPKNDKLVSFIIEETKKGNIERETALQFKDLFMDAALETAVQLDSIYVKEKQGIKWFWFVVGVATATAVIGLLSILI